jgi:hypothetical protein
MKCKKPGCDGDIENGLCRVCGATGSDEKSMEDNQARQAVIASVRKLLEPREVSPSKEDLARAAESLKTVVPYNYEAWRLHADLLLNALVQITNRTLQPDPAFTLLAIPLRENDLRDAAEDALRKCARFADSEEKRISLVDEANRARRMTWL